jgi:hypothetical protein
MFYQLSIGHGCMATTPMISLSPGISMPSRRDVPSPADFVVVIAKAELGDWIDPTDVPLCWECLLYDPDGMLVGDGHAFTQSEAMALAWLNVHAPDALWLAHVEPGSVPFEIPFGWHFELTPPWRRRSPDRFSARRR